MHLEGSASCWKPSFQNLLIHCKFALPTRSSYIQSLCFLHADLSAVSVTPVFAPSPMQAGNITFAEIPAIMMGVFTSAAESVPVIEIGFYVLSANILLLSWTTRAATSDPSAVRPTTQLRNAFRVPRKSELILI